MTAKRATLHQIERWKRLSMGLAKSWHVSMTDARRRRLIEAVEDCVVSVSQCYGDEYIAEWEGAGGIYVCDRVDDYLWDRRFYLEGRHGEPRGGFGNRVARCVRAGFDLAISPSAGVLGFNVSDLRGACGGAIPKSVRHWFSPPLPPRTAGTEELWL